MIVINQILKSHPVSLLDSFFSSHHFLLLFVNTCNSFAIGAGLSPTQLYLKVADTCEVLTCLSSWWSVMMNKSQPSVEVGTIVCRYLLTFYRMQSNVGSPSGLEQSEATA